MRLRWIIADRNYLTSFGKQVITTGLKLKELFLIPQLYSSPAR